MFRLFIALFILVITMTTASSAESLKLAPQFGVFGGDNEALLIANDNTTLSVGLYGSIMFFPSGNSFFVGYGGFELSAGDHNLKVLTGPLALGGETYITTSLWYTLKNVGVEGLDIFVEGDYVYPTEGGNDNLYLVNPKLSYSVTKTFKVSVTSELLASDKVWMSRATGIVLTIKSVSVFVAYDDVPNQLIVRITLAP